MVTELWRLGRNLQNLISIVDGLRRREIGIEFLRDSVGTTTTPGGGLTFRVFAALGEFIREMIVQGTAKTSTPPEPAARHSAGHRR